MKAPSSHKKHIYSQLEQKILNGIQKGQYANGMPLPSERDLCSRHGVSRQTVRNALRQLISDGWLLPKPGKGTFVQVPPRPPESNQSESSSRQIGLIYPASQCSRNLSLIESIHYMETVFAQAGYALTLSVSRKDSNHQILPCYQNWIRNRSVAGYILKSVHPGLQKQFQKLNQPVLCMGYLWDDANLPSLALDFKKIYYQWVLHHYQRGRKHLRLVTYQSKSTWSQAVLSGFEQGIQETGLGQANSMVYSYDDTPFGLTTVFRRMLREAPRPISVILPSDDHLDIALKFLEMQGLRIPHDIHLTAVQTNPSTCPHLGKIGYFNYDLAGFSQRAATKLLEIIQSEANQPYHELFDQGTIVDPF